MNTLLQSFERHTISERLVSVDLMRGLAALGVLLYHALNFGIFPKAGELLDVTFWQGIYTYPLSFGFTGVYLFFVISGFCIHLRWARAAAASGDLSQTVDFKRFWKRRVRRIYPAYLAAIFVYLSIKYYLGHVEINSFFVWDLLSHIFMIHNFSVTTVYSLNSVFWTLAVEEQLYLAYFLLLWLRKKYGWKITLSICLLTRLAWFAASFLIIKMTGHHVPVTESAFGNWWIWALGALSVEAFYGIIKLPKIFYSPRLSLAILTVTAGFYTLYWLAPTQQFFYRTLWIIIQPLWGLGFFVLVNYLVSCEKQLLKKIAPVGKALIAVGLFSYSLYLTHEIVFLLLPEFFALKIVFSIVFARLFYLMFEKPFLNISGGGQLAENAAAVK